MKKACQASILILVFFLLTTCNNGDLVLPNQAILISSIAPTNSSNLGPVIIQEIIGLRFSSGVTVKLTKSGETPIEAAGIIVTGDSNISCEFDLTGGAAGLWDLEISDGILDTGVLLGGFTVTNARYVSTNADGGDDGNIGTASSPMETIQAAVAASSSGEEVRVSAGTYTVDSASQIVMKNGVSLRGGYDPDTWEQDIDSNTTTVQDTSSDPSSIDVPHCVFKAAGEVQTGTVLEGFTINGSTDAGADYTSAIFLDHISGDAYGPTIRYNTIDGGSGSEYSYGIYARGRFDAVIEYNSINGGSGSVSTYAFYGVLLDNTLIQNNRIDGGSGTQTYGIFIRQGSDPYISNNLIYGGSGSHTHGIYCQNNPGNTVVIRNNTVDGGLGDSNHSYAIYNRTTQPVIQNNILFSTGNANRYGIYENDTSSDPAAINNNDIFDCSTALYYDYYDVGPSALTDISDVNSIAEADGNISVDPVFTDAGGGNYHVGASELRAGLNGIDQSWVNFPEDDSGNPIDYEGTGRPASGNPWNIGAYE